MRNIAVIPARGGSKRIPRKNIKRMGGVPLIGWSIRAAQQTGVFDLIIVSTEDEEIASVAVEEGAVVPFMRPADLADDYTPTVPVIRHAIGELERLGMGGDTYACIFPSSPLMRASTLLEAHRILESDLSSYVFPAAPYNYPPQRGFTIDEDGRSKMREPENYFQRTQDLPRVFHDVGQFFWAARDVWINEDYFHEPGRPIPVREEDVQDMDTEEDWFVTEQKLLAMNAEGERNGTGNYGS